MRQDKFQAFLVHVRRTQPLIFFITYQRLNRTEILLSLLSSPSLRRRTFLLFFSLPLSWTSTMEQRTLEREKQRQRERNRGSERGNCYANYEYDWCVMQTEFIRFCQHSFVKENTRTPRLRKRKRIGRVRSRTEFRDILTIGNGDYVDE